MKSQTVLFILFALLLAACRTVAPAQQVTVIPEMTVTLTPAATVTATTIPTASATPNPVPTEVDLSGIEGMTKTEDGKWLYTDKSGVSHTYSESLAKGAKFDSGVLIIGADAINTETGDVQMLTGVVPEITGLSEAVDSLPVAELDMTSSDWQKDLKAMFKRAAVNIDETQIWKKFALEYEGQLVIPRPNSLKINIYPDSGIANVIATVTLNSVDQNGKVGVVVWGPDNYYQRVNSSTPLTFPMRALDQGWFVINASDGTSEYRVIAMPVAIMGKDGVPVVKYALTDEKAWDPKILESLNSGRGLVQPLVVVGANAGGDWQQAVVSARTTNESGPRLKMMADNALVIAAQMNQVFFRTHINSGFIEMSDLEGIVLVARAVEPLPGPYMQVDVKPFEPDN